VEFVELQKAKADSQNSWSINIKDIDQATFDLSVKNPNQAEKLALREPKDILKEMSDLDKASEKIFQKIKNLI
jgi:type I restriction enzyme M protein